MQAPKLQLKQNISQQMAMHLSQQQIFAMELLAMGSEELRKEIYKKTSENPALEITRDKLLEGATALKKGSLYLRTREPYTRTRTVSSANELAADNFQAMLETSADKTETLQEHLLHQLNMLNLPKKENALCTALIQNLDKNGFHTLAPESLVPNEERKTTLLDRCLSIIQSFDPAGICCKNAEESLFIQAKQKENPPELALFILSGHLELITPPDAAKSQKKIKEFIKTQKSLSFLQNAEPFLLQDASKITEEKVQEAISFIKTLTPYPARAFAKTGTDQTVYIQPDADVTQEPEPIEKDNFDLGLIKNDDISHFKVKLSESVFPEVRIAGGFEKAQNSDKDGFIQKKVQEASLFLQTLEFRKKTLLYGLSALVAAQKDFFMDGPGHLAPLTQRQFAGIINVHESTVSRMAESKFIRCKYGTFPVKYFFTNAVSKNTENAESEAVSADKIRFMISEILKNQKPEEKSLSDQKISDMLLERGVHVARRTVAKYRAKLNIASSYDRL